MAVAVILEFKDTTLEQYDQVVAKMGFTTGGPGGPGGLFHWVTPTDTGFRITDVWETREHFEKFAETDIGPKTAEVGIVNKPEITFYEVYNYLVGGSD